MTKEKSTSLAKAASADIEAQEQTQEQAFKGLLDRIMGRLEEVATPHLPPEKLIRVALGEAARNPRIRECTPSSVALALMATSQVGLEPGGQLGLMWLIPRRNRHNNNQYELDAQVGYKGWLELARRSGLISYIHAAVVRQWELDQGLVEISLEPPRVVHGWGAPPGPAKDSEIVAAYCVVETTDGARCLRVLNREEIELRRKRGATKSGGAWGTDYAAMARKSAILALMTSGEVPLSTELRYATTLGDHVPEERTTAAGARVAAYSRALEAPAAGELPPGEADG
jgi:recombination protein RecT